METKREMAQYIYSCFSTQGPAALVTQSFKETVSLYYTRFSSIDEMANILLLSGVDVDHVSNTVVCVFNVIRDKDNIDKYIKHISNAIDLISLRAWSYTNSEFTGNDEVRQLFMNKVLELKADNKWLEYWPNDSEYFA